MKKKDIEDRDFERWNMLREMRLKGAKNQSDNQMRAEPNSRNPRNLVMAAILVLVVLGAAAYFAGKKMRNDPHSSASSPNNPKKGEYRYPVPRNRSETIAATNPKDASKTRPNIRSTTPAFSVEDLSRRSFDSSAGRDSESLETKGSEPDPPPTGSESSFSPYGARIARYLVCSGVKARECASPQTHFTLTGSVSPHMWMEVFSETVPYALKHVYYHEGRKFVEIPLGIKHRRMRTWSYVTLNDAAQAGSWHVEIQTVEGKVLGRAEFKVGTAG